jgi:hypothetical protein
MLIDHIISDPGQPIFGFHKNHGAHKPKSDA